MHSGIWSRICCFYQAKPKRRKTVVDKFEVFFRYYSSCGKFCKYRIIIPRAFPRNICSTASSVVILLCLTLCVSFFVTFVTASNCLQSRTKWPNSCSCNKLFCGARYDWGRTSSLQAHRRPGEQEYPVLSWPVGARLVLEVVDYFRSWGYRKNRLKRKDEKDCRSSWSSSNSNFADPRQAWLLDEALSQWTSENDFLLVLFEFRRLVLAEMVSEIWTLEFPASVASWHAVSERSCSLLERGARPRFVLRLNFAPGRFRRAKQRKEGYKRYICYRQYWAA